MQVVALSPEQWHYMWACKCPRCDRWVFRYPRFSLPDGTPVSGLRWMRLMDERTVASCWKCGGTWPVFKTAVSPVTPSDVAAVQMMETRRVDEAIGQDVRRINNSSAASTVLRTRATRRWTQHIEFADDRISVSSRDFTLTLPQIATLKAGAENTLHHQTRGGRETEQTFEEEIELSVPAHTALELVMHWKRIWQVGAVIGVTTAGVTIQMPYRAVVGLTFDPVTRQVAGSLPEVPGAARDS